MLQLLQPCYYMKLFDKEKQINILFEDNHILVAEKPSPYLTQPTALENCSLESFLKTYLKKRDNKLNNVYLNCINRLDKKVSGIVLFAKSAKALVRLQKMQVLRNFEKRYIAKVHGYISEKNGILINHLTHENFRAKISNSANKNAKLSKLSYQVIGYDLNDTFVIITLDTGRYHQIRAQFSHINHPIIGDKKYKSILDYDSIMLHHALLAFKHPVTQKLLCLVSKPYFDDLINVPLFDKHLKQLL
jgi:23S rRNA pseudouridine1911/1915/1917 synthase